MTFKMYFPKLGSLGGILMRDEVIVSTLPDCDICKSRGVRTPARFDGKAKNGPWAYMCGECFDSVGIGLGVGKGQKLVLVDE